MKPKFSFVIDVIGTCNLSCPSCPVGNFQEARNASGVMAPELLEQILKKAESECSVEYIALYNWTEPLLHPALPKLIRTVHDHGFRCFLSSNLNRHGLLWKPKKSELRSPTPVYPGRDPWR